MNKNKFEEFIDEFMQESDRAAIVLGAAQMDDLLTEMLKKRLIEVTSDLFDFNGPFGTFSAKIQAMRSTGVIDGEFASKIHIVRRIRNKCAHNIRNVDLNSQSISQQISELSSSFVGKEYWKSTKQEAENTFKIQGNALALRLSIAFLTANLTQIYKYVKPIDASSTFEINVPQNET